MLLLMKLTGAASNPVFALSAALFQFVCRIGRICIPDLTLISAFSGHRLQLHLSFKRNVKGKHLVSVFLAHQLSIRIERNMLSGWNRSSLWSWSPVCPHTGCRTDERMALCSSMPYRYRSCPSLSSGQMSSDPCGSSPVLRPGYGHPPRSRTYSIHVCSTYTDGAQNTSA